MKPDLTLLLIALEFAAHKHRDQRRKDASASPYINHPIALARLLAVEGGVTDVKTLPKPRRKALQIEHAPHLSRRAALVKLADKTCNLRDVAHHPPAGWPLARRRQYLDWARAVVEALPPVSKKLRRAFDAAHALRP
jgi:GTP diphosphokinase / guanosine-3',5'-bis(diphosphate) 3'-diphosphatase